MSVTEDGTYNNHMSLKGLIQVEVSFTPQYTIVFPVSKSVTINAKRNSNQPVPHIRYSFVTSNGRWTVWILITSEGAVAAVRCETVLQGGDVVSLGEVSPTFWKNL